jgi:drug/metabolite transporter (DMT)-like permease
VTTKRKLAYIALITTVIIWGVAFPFIKPALDIISPLQYLYFRFLAAGIISLPIFLWYYLKEQPKISYLIKVLFIELLGITIPLYLLYEGLARTSSLDASLLGSVGPIFITLGGIWFLHERQSKREWQGMALALLGSTILVVAPLFTGATDSPSSTTGNLLIMGYNLTYTIYALLGKHIYKTKPPLFLGSPTYLATALIYGLILSAKNSLPPISLLISNSTILMPVLYMAIPGGILAFALHLYAVSKIEVSEANLFTYLNGVIAIPAAYFLLGEKPTLFTLLAILIIAYGVYRAETRSSQ